VQVIVVVVSVLAFLLQSKVAPPLSVHHAAEVVIVEFADVGVEVVVVVEFVVAVPLGLW